MTRPPAARVGIGCSLVFPRAAAVAALARLRRHPSQPLWLSCGFGSAPAPLWLVRSWQAGPPPGGPAAGWRRLEAAEGSGGDAGPSIGVVKLSLAGPPRIEGGSLMGDIWMPLREIRLPGSGMERLTGELPRVPPADEERWSRSAGALGTRTWRRMAHLKAGVVGCGRLGSLVAQALGADGVGRALEPGIVLVDPDVVELHNLGESALFRDEDIGENKATRLAARLERRHPALRGRVAAVPAGVGAVEAERALAACEVLFCCVDRPEARLRAAALASRYHMVLLDLGTGIFPRDGGTDKGADVRLLLPGEACLLCSGGVGDRAAAMHALIGGAEEPVPWHRQRRGSLRALNELAVADAFLLLQGLVAGAITTSVWRRWESGPHGRLVPELLPVRQAPTPGCAWCALSGWGDLKPG